MKLHKPNKIILYDEGCSQSLSIEEIAKHLRKNLTGVKIESAKNPFGSIKNRIPGYAQKIASIKIQNAEEKISSEQKALYGEIEFEKRRISGKTTAFGVLYDGFCLQRIFRDLIPKEERRFELVHIFFTNRLFGTWDEPNKRYHVRVSVYGLPSIISTAGIVEAPAKPKEFYFYKQQYELLKKDILELKDRFKGRFIDHEDDRMTEALKGYALQAVFNSLIGDPFCEDKGCRLYNAHWQQELIYAQIDSGYEFCSFHKKLIDNLKENRD